MNQFVSVSRWRSATQLYRERKWYGDCFGPQGSGVTADGVAGAPRRSTLFSCQWMDDCNQSKKDFCPDYSLQSVSLGYYMYIILWTDSTASRTLPLSTLPKTWWEIWRTIGHLPFEREGVSFHFFQWVLPATVTMGTPSWPLSIQELTPFNVHFHKTMILGCLFTERSSLTRSFSVNGYAGNFSVRGHSKHFAFRGTKWKYGK